MGIAGRSGMAANSNRDREKKIGHRRVDDTGQVTYKKVHNFNLLSWAQTQILPKVHMYVVLLNVSELFKSGGNILKILCIH